jgi:hypothetical protein
MTEETVPSIYRAYCDECEHEHMIRELSLSAEEIERKCSICGLREIRKERKEKYKNG